ncbi:unnamed protein product [Moneuplotes crassus]|uniref:Uncharacterized protein n=1 Tax=Euplotes crassus TaxID=5936 RepID=A0AAD1XNP9_EUPCR|nr:unnamed protein product [Moneuplotes crassus]
MIIIKDLPNQSLPNSHMESSQEVRNSSLFESSKQSDEYHESDSYSPESEEYRLNLLLQKDPGNRCSDNSVRTVPKRGVRKRRSRKKCKYIPRSIIPNEDSKSEKFELESNKLDNDHNLQGYWGRNYLQVNMNYLEPIMEMNSFDERGSVSLVCSHNMKFKNVEYSHWDQGQWKRGQNPAMNPNLVFNYRDAEINELKELKSNEPLFNRIPYLFYKNTSKALKYSRMKGRKSLSCGPHCKNIRKNPYSMVKKMRVRRR